MPEVHEVSVQIGGAEIVFETGRLAKQASGAVLVASGDTRVLATATAGNLRDVPDDVLDRCLAEVDGSRMLLHQASRQFELYTGRPAPLEAMNKALQSTVG